MYGVIRKSCQIPLRNRPNQVSFVTFRALWRSPTILFTSVSSSWIRLRTRGFVALSIMDQAEDAEGKI